MTTPPAPASAPPPRRPRAAGQRARAWVTELALRVEGRCGVLGPAHRGYDGNSIEENRRIWTGYDWSAGSGEEWSESPEWKRSVVEHLLEPLVPAGAAVLEIGPGSGRWSEPLHARAGSLTLVDITPRTLDLCRERLGEDVACVLGNGHDVPGVPDASIDVVWSFDALVHVAPVDVDGYLDEIARVLVPGGRAILHHSGTRGRRDPGGGRGWRAPMTGRLLANLARGHGLEVERQLDSWDGGRHGVRVYGDVVSVLRRPAS